MGQQTAIRRETVIDLDSTVEIDPRVVHSLVDQIVDEASVAAGGDLADLHTRKSVEGLEQRISRSVSPLCAELMRVLAGPGAFIQASPNVRIHRPLDHDSPIPFHSDVLY